jgi:protein SCO1/2
MQIRRTLPWFILLGVVAIIGGALLARMLAHPSVAIETGTWLPESRSIGTVRLTDVTGQSFTEQSLRGHASLVFFGFTFCPDLCPTTLSTLAQLQRNPPIQSATRRQPCVSTWLPSAQTLWGCAHRSRTCRCCCAISAPLPSA